MRRTLLIWCFMAAAVFLSMDVGEFFALDAVTVKLDGEEVTHHLYTERQGQHRLTAFFTGRGPSDRDYRRAATVEFEKSFGPTFIGLAIRDSESKYQPEFSAAVSN